MGDFSLFHRNNPLSLTHHELQVPLLLLLPNSTLLDNQFKTHHLALYFHGGDFCFFPQNLFKLGPRVALDRIYHSLEKNNKWNKIKFHKSQTLTIRFEDKMEIEAEIFHLCGISKINNYE